MESVGFIRGEETVPLNPALQDAASYGMQLMYTDRKQYRNPDLIKQKEHKPGWYWIPEGGYGITGARGASTLLQTHDATGYSHIICAVGTGTMMAGLIRAAQPTQQVTGISVLKNNPELLQQVEQLLDEPDLGKNYQLLHDYHFGGYAKHPSQLIAYMNDLWKREQIPTDIVYTGKLLYAVEKLIVEDFFPEKSRLLVIHSGGLQGNRSLPSGTLLF
jgi:1-aminocyclopropane-1-carboxylate deaminase